ncbi:MAG TPA: hybrid sensor histidine kinase/response regulator, partial [Burkholderiaceae bacterium]|nr:hybrid sensor histidine kinase/response regulator [Burkholderiaceae bacterium]
RTFGSQGPEVLAVPIGIAQGGEIGMLYLVHVADGRYSEEDRALVRQLTLLAAAAIRNAQLAEEERRARLEAEAASVTKDEFLAIVSHELRTPLHAILGWLGVIERRRGDSADGGDKLAQALAVIRRNAEALIDDLLDLSRIEQGKLQFDREAVELAQVVAAAVESHRLLAVERGVELLSLVEASGIVLGDDLRLQQVASNLLGNALKFTPAGGRVSVRLRRERGEFVLEVADTGQGIAPDMLEHIFDRFRQVDTSSKRRQGGLGLGLALVRHIVEMHGGSVRAFSEGEGRGSTFVATFPVMAASPDHGFDLVGPAPVGDTAAIASDAGTGAPAAGMQTTESSTTGTAADLPASATSTIASAGNETLHGTEAAVSLSERQALAAGPAGQSAVNDDHASAARHRPPVEVSAPPGGQPMHSQVMIIDDIADARVALGDLLDAHGYGAIDRPSADAALQWLEEQPRAAWPIGVLCDIEMPDRDGFEFIVALRELEARLKHEPPLPVVALTAYGGIERRIRAREHGFMAYLLKPVRSDRLLRLLESLLH